MDVKLGPVGPERDEVTGGCKEIHDEKFHNLYSSPSSIGIIKSRTIRWVGHVARMAGVRNAHKILVGKPEGKRQLGRSRYRRENDNKMDLGEIGLESVDWIDLAENRGQWWALVNTVKSLQVP
jgi:hypothetical protein